MIRIAGCILLLTGVAKAFSAIGPVRALDTIDPLTGIPFRQLFLLAGLAELLIAFFCLFVESVEQARARLQEAPPDVLILSADPEQARSQRSRRQLGEALPGVPVLALVAVLEKGSILQILQDGATGVLVLPVTPAQVADAVRRLARGETVLCAQAQVASVQFFQDAERAASGAQLSYAERRVMQALILGKNNAGIAEQTGLGLETVHSHLTRIYKKLNVHNRKDAATKYLKLYGR